MMFGRKEIWLIAAASLGCVCPGFSNPAAKTNPVPQAEFVLPAAVPPIPFRKSPVALFRELLALTPAEQKAWLADRSPEHQRRILVKLREYEALRPSQRELKLRATELQWYLSPLLETSVTNRAELLRTIPDDQRKLVEDRLHDWDQLPPDAQKELLDNEATLRYFTQVEPVTDEQKKVVLDTLSPSRRKKLEAGIARWRELPLNQRQKTLERFNQFFELTPTEKDRSLARLSDEERRQMEKTLRRFDQLPAGQRQQCIQAFKRFTSFSLEERQQFLKNAERWQVMSPEERQNWRELVQKLAVVEPPLPPGLRRSFAPAPPMPPTPGVPGRTTSTVATNERK